MVPALASKLAKHVVFYTEPPTVSPSHSSVNYGLSAVGRISGAGRRRDLEASTRTRLEKIGSFISYLDSRIFSSMSSRSLLTGTLFLAASHTVEQAAALSSASLRTAAVAAAFCSEVRACKEPNAEEKASSIAMSLALAHSTPFVHASLSKALAARATCTGSEGEEEGEGGGASGDGMHRFA